MIVEIFNVSRNSHLSELQSKIKARIIIYIEASFILLQVLYYKFHTTITDTSSKLIDFFQFRDNFEMTTLFLKILIKKAEIFVLILKDY